MDSPERILVVFHRLDYCNPCRVQHALLKEASIPDTPVVWMDCATKEGALAAGALGIRGVPTLALVARNPGSTSYGKVLWKHTGVMRPEAIAQEIGTLGGTK